MASRTVWIVGGLVVAIGAIAYLSYNKAPAGKDAAGTIVEAKRARSDGTNSFNPTATASTTDQNASDASKGMAGPDAAKDAAAAAGGSGDNSRHMDIRNRATGDAADAAAAAGGSGDNARRAADAKAADQAARGVDSSAHQTSAHQTSAQQTSAQQTSAQQQSAGQKD